MTLSSSIQKAGSVAAQVVAAIASVELPAALWPDLIEILLRFMDNTENVNLRIATLQTIGYICESIVSPSANTRKPLTFRILTRLFIRNLIS